MATCCGIIVFTVWELIAIVAGLIALATNAWIVPQVCANMNPLHATTTTTLTSFDRGPRLFDQTTTCFRAGRVNENSLEELT